jgi:hypothetical protein
MRIRCGRYLLVFAFAGMTPFLAACGMRQTGTAPSQEGQVPVQANPGELQGTIPAADAAQATPIRRAGTPTQALERFATGYVNWTYKSLAGDQARLAASAIGEARAVEEQGEAQSSRDTALKRARIYNTGTVVTVSRVAGGGPREWVVVTRERTGGNGEYADTQAAFHVFLATVQHVGNGFSVSAWRPEV